ncbi:hypothetical protein CDAR_320241 [Caerostris darwini]|uniref:Uncharacterized protein n=1 Tax=Caerostris darwini TaxID=1538125 RepID=A0AAV4PHZ9_9ARAC|nr:hypothetical protein CDAR_320241 [Caerostris darwini]
MHRFRSIRYSYQRFALAGTTIPLDFSIKSPCTEHPKCPEDELILLPQSRKDQGSLWGVVETNLGPLQGHFSSLIPLIVCYAPPREHPHPFPFVLLCFFQHAPGNRAE